MWRTPDLVLCLKEEVLAEDERNGLSELCKVKIWLGEVMWRTAELEEVLAEDERNGLSELCKVGYVVWE